MKRILGFALAALVMVVGWQGQAQTQKKQAKTQDAVVDDPKLPRVLLIGDSISIGYTPAVRKLLDGKANVHHNAGNSQDTKNGVAKLKEWLGTGKWDVIHVNFGLHDIKLGTGTHQVPIAEYEKNLHSILKDLKATGAKVIWCSTTPVPEGKLSPPRRNADVIAYNAVAQKAAQEHGITINDLYAFALPQLKEIQRPENVHFTDEGSAKLAAPVADAILKALGK
jgi:acyl-CoA thioesterase-1